MAADPSPDIRKFHRGVSQTYDTIQAAAEWLSRDQKDVEEVGGTVELGDLADDNARLSGSRKTTTFEPSVCQR